MTPEQLERIIKEAVESALAAREAAKTKEEKAEADAELDFANRVYAANREAEELGLKPLERFGMQVLALSKESDPAKALRVIHDEYKAPQVARAIEAEMKRAGELQNPGSGGFLVPGQHMTEIVPLLRPLATIFRLGARQVPLVEGKAFMPYVKEGTTVGWFREGQQIAESDFKLGQLELTAKHLGAVYFVSRFMQAAGARGQSIFQIAGQDMLLAIAQELSRAAKYGTNSSNQPCGMFVDPCFSQANKIDLNALPNYDSLPTMVTEFMKQDPPMSGVKWLFGPDAYREMLKAVSITGQPLFRDELAAGTLFGYEYEIDNQIRAAAGQYKLTDIALAEWPEFMISEFISVSLEVDNSYKFLHHQTAIKSITSLDMGMRQPKAFTLSKNLRTSAT